MKLRKVFVFGFGTCAIISSSVNVVFESYLLPSDYPTRHFFILN